MKLNNVFIHLVGFGGVGKYTIAKELATATGARIVDNHLINNPIFSVIDLKNGGTLHENVWEQTNKIREAVFYAVAYLALPDENFIVTNAVNNRDAIDRTIFNYAFDAAQKRNALYIPVRLHCDLDEHVRRITNPCRAERLKPTNPSRAYSAHAEDELISVDHANVLDLDVTHLSPQESTARILAHIASCL